MNQPPDDSAKVQLTSAKRWAISGLVARLLALLVFAGFLVQASQAGGGGLDGVLAVILTIAMGVVALGVGGVVGFAASAVALTRLHREAVKLSAASTVTRWTIALVPLMLLDLAVVLSFGAAGCTNALSPGDEPIPTEPPPGFVLPDPG